MAIIGTFTKTAKGYTGEIVTMSLQKKKVRLIAEEATDKENAPSHQGFMARAEIGVGWTKTSKEGRDYLSVKLDDPSFAAPNYANLFDDEDGKSLNLIWTRTRTAKGHLPSHPSSARLCRAGLCSPGRQQRKSLPFAFLYSRSEGIANFSLVKCCSGTYHRHCIRTSLHCCGKLRGLIRFRLGLQPISHR